MTNKQMYELLTCAIAGLESPGEISDRDLVDLIQDLRDAANQFNPETVHDELEEHRREISR